MKWVKVDYVCETPGRHGDAEPGGVELKGATAISKMFPVLYEVVYSK
jgi:hypothetical protein